MAVISKFRDHYGVTYFPRHYTHTAHTIILALNIQVAMLAQPLSQFLVGWGSAVTNLAQLPTYFIPAAGLYFTEKKELSYPVTVKRIIFFCSQKRPNRVWALSSLYSMGTGSKTAEASSRSLISM
jgi:hypothetical protein